MSNKGNATTTTATVLEVKEDLVIVTNPKDVIASGQNIGQPRIYDLVISDGSNRKILTSTVPDFELTDTKIWNVSEVLKCQIRYTSGTKLEITIFYKDEIMFNKLNAQDMFRGLDSLTGTNWKTWLNRYGNWRKNGKTGNSSHSSAPAQVVQSRRIT